MTGRYTGTCGWMCVVRRVKGPVLFVLWCAGRLWWYGGFGSSGIRCLLLVMLYGLGIPCFQWC